MIKYIKKKLWISDKKYVRKQVDLYVLELLEEEFLNQNLDYVNINKKINKKFIKSLWVSIAYVRKRVFYHIWVGNIDLKNQDFNNPRSFRKKLKENGIPLLKMIKKTKNWFSIDRSLYYKYFLEVKITRDWLKQISRYREKLNRRFLSFDLKRLKEIYEYFFYTKKLATGLGALIVVVFSVMWSLSIEDTRNYMASVLSPKNDFPLSSQQDKYFSPVNIQKENQIYDVFTKWVFENYDVFWLMPDNIRQIRYRRISENIALYQVETIEWKEFYFNIKYEWWVYYVSDITKRFEN